MENPDPARKLSTCICLYMFRTEALSETCRVSFQSKFEKLVHLADFIIKKFVTMHGHMNAKFSTLSCQYTQYK
jgi:hypothetical protein